MCARERQRQGECVKWFSPNFESIAIRWLERFEHRNGHEYVEFFTIPRWFISTGTCVSNIRKSWVELKSIGSIRRCHAPARLTPIELNFHFGHRVFLAIDIFGSSNYTRMRCDKHSISGSAFNVSSRTALLAINATDFGNARTVYRDPRTHFSSRTLESHICEWGAQSEPRNR